MKWWTLYKIIPRDSHLIIRKFYISLEHLRQKAFHPLFSLRRHIDFSKLKPSLASKIFDTMGMISPILPYNSEVWGAFEKSDFKSCGVCTLFFNKKNQRLFKDFQGLTFPIFQGLNSVQKEPGVYVFFSSSTTWVILARRPFCVCSFLFVVLLKL